MAKCAFAWTLLLCSSSFVATATRAADATCATPLASIVSIRGSVLVLRGAGVAPVAAVAADALCAGDTLIVQSRSQAALLLGNATTIRLDEGTTVTLAPSADVRPPLLRVATGAAYVISRTPRPFRIRTPFINANVEGTEFLVEVRRGREMLADPSCPYEPDPSAAGPATDRITVYEGLVQAANASETVAVTVGGGETAVATATEGPVKSLVVVPRDAVTWTLYVPSVLSGGRAVEPGVACAARLLALGRFDEARKKLEGALPADRSRAGARDSATYALLSTLAVARNDKDAAQRDADRAVELDPRSNAAWIARSHAQQANFRIDEALASVRSADALGPDALTKARLAELLLATGDVDAALAAAVEARAADPGLARAQTVLGYALLVRLDIQAAQEAFRTAIRIDPADPLARLGLGLARIRAGDLAGGREDIEIAAALDTDSSLVRSYLGKAYFEERRDALAESQLELAKALDPRDPTPWFYGAILKQVGNRPVEALQDLQRAIALNDNRAVYRSRLLLDQDQASRMVSLARVYRQLGFDQLALLESVKSLSLDPADSSAHRFLSDSYIGQVRTEAARVAELLQAQLRQPLGLNSIEPQLLADQHVVVEGAGPVQASGQEFTPLFNRNQVTAKVDGLVGNRRTVGDQVFVSGLADRLAYSVGQFHYETHGVRENNDVRRDLASAFVQFGLTPGIRLQAELRDDRTRQGDLYLRFDDDDFSPTLREEFQQQTVRVGGLFAIDTASSIVASAIAGEGKDRRFSSADPTAFIEDRERLQAYELQYLLKAQRFHLTAGVSTYRNHGVLEVFSVPGDISARERSLYALATVTALPWGLRPQVGFSHDSFRQGDRSVSRFDPKLGLIWTPTADTTVRAAWFRVIKRTFVANQTLQPSQIAGFNQFFDEPNGTRSTRAGLALHQRLSPTTFVGAEGSARNIQVPGFALGDPDFDWKERFARAYLYRILDARTSMTAELQFERLQRPEANTGSESFTDLRNVFVPLGLRIRWPSSWSATLQATVVRQKARYIDAVGDLADSRATFGVVDAGVSYQLPRRAGWISVEAKNLFDRRFRYQEIDVFSSPRVVPHRLVMLRIAAAF